MDIRDDFSILYYYFRAYIKIPTIFVRYFEMYK